MTPHGDAVDAAGDVVMPTGIVVHLVGHAKRGLVVPAGPDVADTRTENAAATAQCAGANAVHHSEICAARAARRDA